MDYITKYYYHTRAIWIKFSVLAVLIFILFLSLIRYYGNRNYIDLAFLDVGQGDSAIFEIVSYDTSTSSIHKQVHRLMIDTGRSTRVLSSIEKFNSRTLYQYFFHPRNIDTLLLTHNDEDHIGMRCEIINRYQVQNIIISNSMATDTLLSCDSEHTISSRISSAYDAPGHINLFYVHSGDNFDLGQVHFDVLNPDSNFKPKDNSDNESSIVLLATFSTSSATTTNVDHRANYKKVLFTGDIDKKVERTILNKDANPLSHSGSSPRGAGLTPNPSPIERGIRNIDILKVAHHGSDGSSDTNFIRYTRPDISIISVGHNSYGHPSQRVLDDLMHASSTIHRTDQEGNVLFHWE